MPDLKNTFLVQRLARPYKPLNPDSGPLAAIANSFAFGGGKKNGGFSGEAMDVLTKIFSFEYMGSAEFEYGAVPECLSYIAENISQYTTFSGCINQTTYYAIGLDALKDRIAERINDLAHKKCHLQEWTNFDVACGMSLITTKDQCKTIGWIELNNKFMFFTDKEMFLSAAQLFGLKFNEQS